MSPPSPADQARSLAALIGTEVDYRQRHDTAMIAMITEAKRRGITWRQIASVLGCHSPAHAKTLAKGYARSAQAAMLRHEAGSAGGN